MFTYEEATAFVVSNLRRAADAQDAGRLQEIEAGFDELDAKLTRGGGHEWDKLHIALIFWDSWIDSKNHHWGHYKAIRERDWPELAREIADHIEAGHEIKNPRVLAHFALRPREGALSFRRRRKMRKALVIGFLALAAMLVVGRYVAPIVFQFTGWLHRSEHEFSGSVTLDRPPEQVYALLTDYERLPEWFSPCKSVEIQRVDDHTLWVATFANGEVAHVLGMEIEPSRYLIWRFTSKNRHVSAMWEFELTPQAGSTQLSLKTRGIAHHWIYRITSESIIDDEAHIREFLDALAAESGKPLEPQRDGES